MSETILKTNVAGLSIGGGKKENFFFCLLEFFPDKNRWFLSGLHPFKEEEFHGHDEVITNWVANYNLKDLVVDFPLTRPICETCELVCPGALNCHNPGVTAVRNYVDGLLKSDLDLHQQNPKKYEYARNDEKLVDRERDMMRKSSQEAILSKSFKRRLKKGFTPYWHRPIDFFVWSLYYDQMLEMFGITYDSFGTTSMMLLARFNYLKRHFPNDLAMSESCVYICLLELLRSKIISKKQLKDLDDLELVVFTRMSIVRSIEKSLNLFIYEHDVEVLGKNPKAFDSFLLALSGQRFLLNKTQYPPEWAQGKLARSIFPLF